MKVWNVVMKNLECGQGYLECGQEYQSIICGMWSKISVKNIWNVVKNMSTRITSGCVEWESISMAPPMSHDMAAIQDGVQGHLAHKKPAPSLGPPKGHRHRPTAGSQEGAVSYERGTPVPPGVWSGRASRKRLRCRTICPPLRAACCSLVKGLGCRM